MKLLYAFGIFLYGLAINIASLFNHKASLWVKGRKNLFDQLETKLRIPDTSRASRKLAWFHCASLGEFEQGRPLIEEFRLEHPEYFLLLTFFSPSGYEIRKDYSGADLVIYLPLDTRRNARRFLNLVRPDIAFFVKYEFWFNYLRFLQADKIPGYLVSGIFRKDQHFFRWYGGWSRSILRGYTHIFVQNESSAALLAAAGIGQVTVSGDTRFDRVAAIASGKKDLPVIEAFVGKSRVLVAGSSWPPDEELIVRYMTEKSDSFKLIIAPHEIKQMQILALQKRFGSKALLYSSANVENARNSDILIIDSIGLLSQLYRFGSIAYIGGGFGAGIHNVLEAAVFGLPVLFGPDYRRFGEAVDLVSLNAAFPVRDYAGFEKQLSSLLSAPELLKQAGYAAREYVDTRKGATRTIMKEIDIQGIPASVAGGK